MINIISVIPQGGFKTRPYDTVGFIVIKITIVKITVLQKLYHSFVYNDDWSPATLDIRARQESLKLEIIV